MTTQTSLQDDRFTNTTPTPTPTLEADILGTHTYTGIYDPNTVDVNVNIITGEQTTKVLTADEMNHVTESWNTEKVPNHQPDNVALPLSGEQQAERPPELQSKYPFTWACFYHPDIVGHDRYKAYKTAYNSEHHPSLAKRRTA
jgi:hypothetical protein